MMAGSSCQMPGVSTRAPTACVVRELRWFALDHGHVHRLRIDLERVRWDLPYSLELRSRANIVVSLAMHLGADLCTEFCLTHIVSMTGLLLLCYHQLKITAVHSKRPSMTSREGICVITSQPASQQLAKVAPGSYVSD